MMPVRSALASLAPRRKAPESVAGLRRTGLGPTGALRKRAHGRNSPMYVLTVGGSAEMRATSVLNYHAFTVVRV